jgi:hypothetical protein
MAALRYDDRGQVEATDLMKPPAWSGNFWGPSAWRARLTGELPPLPTNTAMAQVRRWGLRILRDGDIVFRLGDARLVHGIVPASLYVAKATASPFSHTGIVAVEDGTAMVYDCSGAGVQRQPFEVWMLDCVGAFGVKRLKAEHRRHIPGVIQFCRKAYEQQVPFDYHFRLDDSAFYCLELTEKAFRSQGLMLSEPVRIGDWEYLGRYPLTALMMLRFTGLALQEPIPIEQPTYLPGNERQGVWASPYLETVVGPEPKYIVKEAPRKPGAAHVWRDIELFSLAGRNIRSSYHELPIRFLGRLAIQARDSGLLSLPADLSRLQSTAQNDYQSRQTSAHAGETARQN